MLNQTDFEKSLVAAKILSQLELNKYAKEAKQKKMPLVDFLLGDRLIKEKEAFKKIAEIKKVPFIDLTGEIIRKDILQLIPEPIAQSHSLVAFGIKSSVLKVASLDPTDLQTFAFIEKKAEMLVEV